MRICCQESGFNIAVAAVIDSVSFPRWREHKRILHSCNKHSQRVTTNLTPKVSNRLKKCTKSSNKLHPEGRNNLNVWVSLRGGGYSKDITISWPGSGTGKVSNWYRNEETTWYGSGWWNKLSKIFSSPVNKPYDGLKVRK